MMSRCYQRRHISYRNYGAKGIRVCKRWHSFENFYADMGDRPQGHSIERLKNHIGYRPGNCRWATVLDQANNRSNNVRILFRGETKTLAQWIRALGLKKSTVKNRWRARWSIARIFSEAA